MYTMTEREINPLTRLDYPDPDVIRVDNTYYMVSTTMHFMPGCEILKSYDLVHWEHETYVYDRLDSTPGQCLAEGQEIYGKGMWAACIRYHKGMFYIFFVANDTGKTYLYQSEKMSGPWKKQYIDGFYHDCSVLFDDDGRTFIVYGNKNIYLTELNEALTGPKEGGIHRLIVSDKDNERLGYEGSHFYKINGKYYVFFIRSLPDQWRRVESCFVADSIDGEFLGGDVFNDDRGYMGQGVAQGGIVDTPDGKWYAILFQDSGAVGRLPVLMPMHFENALPVLGVDGKIPEEFEITDLNPGYVYEPLVDSDDFGKTGSDPKKFGTFGLKSMWQFNHEPDFSLVKLDTEKKQVRMTVGQVCETLPQAKNVLTVRMAYPGCTGTITVDTSGLREGDYAGICAFQGMYGMIAATIREGKRYLVVLSNEAILEELHVLQAGECSLQEKACIPLDSEVVTLRVEACFDRMKDEVQFFYQDKEKFLPLGPVKKVQFKLDHFTGCRFGLFCYGTKEIGGTAGFSDFVYDVK